MNSDLKVPVPDDLKPKGLIYYQETPLRLPSPPPDVIWHPEKPSAKQEVFDRLNLRRLALAVLDSRGPVRGLKITRRSRRRWRGRGGLWSYDKSLLDKFEQAVLDFKRHQGI